ncbi:phosphotransferase family protein [Nocardioides luteus]|uniref:phosphotransferase family protein n=1 Tax=Nocardioides luteus TaxID=1844 RepID=UPI0018C989C0|nr:phosphotransferase [Nocardioides luteus]MBG6095180.1 aminoglycoside phosphotransferase (APT) family kinase protein [Nocardioides luteus]
MSFGELGGGLRPLDGGWSGETFLAEAGGERSVVRVFADPRHHPQAAEIHEALHRLVRGLVPVPGVLEVRHADPALGTPALLVTEFVEGVRGDLLLPDLDEADRGRLGRALGEIAGTLAGMPFLTAGTFADKELRIEPFALDLPEWVASLAERLAWSPADLEGLRDVTADAQDLLDTVGRVSLVHSDLNPKNLIVDPETLQVRAVLDWEFAHAGSPFADLGNLLRFERDAAYVSGVLESYVAMRGGSTRDALDLARSADLVALVELGARRTDNPVAARAHELLLEIARSGDVHSAPEGSVRR